MNRIYVRIEAPPGIKGRSQGEQFFSLLKEYAPSLSPERYGTCEPLRGNFVRDDLRTVLSDWVDEYDFNWLNKSTKAEGSALVSRCFDKGSRFHGLTGSAIDVYAAPSGNVIPEAISLLKAMSVGFRAHFGYVHILTEAEVMRGIPPGTAFKSDPRKDDYIMAVALQDLVRYVPDIYWGTIFGRVYVEHFGRDQLLSSPAPKVEELQDGSIYLQLSPSPLDLVSNFDQIEYVRKSVKEHLDRNSFWDPAKPLNHEYSIPDFRLTIS